MSSGNVRLDPQQAAAVIREFLLREAAWHRYQETAEEQDIRVEVLDLSVAQDIDDPLELGPCKTVYISAANDTNLTVSARVNSTKKHQGAVPMVLKDTLSLNSESRSFNNVFLHWDAQGSGAQMIVIVFLRADFRSGLSVSRLEGSVINTEGSTFETMPKAGLDLTGLAATQVLPIDVSRSTARIVNHTSETLWFGDVNVTDDSGAYPGDPVPPGGSYSHGSTAALYAYNPGSTITDAAVCRNVSSA